MNHDNPTHIQILREMGWMINPSWEQKLRLLNLDKSIFQLSLNSLSLTSLPVISDKFKEILNENLTQLSSETDPLNFPKFHTLPGKFIFQIVSFTCISRPPPQDTTQLLPIDTHKRRVTDNSESSIDNPLLFSLTLSDGFFTFSAQTITKVTIGSCFKNSKCLVISPQIFQGSMLLTDQNFFFLGGAAIYTRRLFPPKSDFNKNVSLPDNNLSMIHIDENEESDTYEGVMGSTCHSTTNKSGNFEKHLDNIQSNLNIYTPHSNDSSNTPSHNSTLNSNTISPNINQSPSVSLVDAVTNSLEQFSSTVIFRSFQPATSPTHPNIIRVVIEDGTNCLENIHIQKKLLASIGETNSLLVSRFNVSIVRKNNIYHIIALNRILSN